MMIMNEIFLQIHACPSVWIEYLPGQAIHCSLAHLTIPSPCWEAATQAMVHMTDVTDIWTVKVSDGVTTLTFVYDKVCN